MPVYVNTAKSPANSNGINARYDAAATEDGDGAAAERLLVVKTSEKPMSVELKQFVLLTSGTSFASAKVMSTHCEKGNTSVLARFF